jgi:hypothetical protein
MRARELVDLIPDVQPPWVDDEFKVWLDCPVRRVNCPIIIIGKDDDVDLSIGIRFVRGVARRYFELPIPEQVAREMFVLCVVNSAARNVNLTDTLWEALNAFIRTATQGQA